MARITLSEGFLDALAGLDRADARRVSAFLRKFITESSAAGFRPEIVHDAADHSVRVYKVTHDLRAVARIVNDEVVMLHVDRHDHAYVWAKTHCFGCDSERGTYELAEKDHATGTMHVCSTEAELCAVLDERGVIHGLTV